MKLLHPFSRSLRSFSSTAKRTTQIRRLPSKNDASVYPLRISDDVKNATRSGQPVVALESTIYTHGFPYPDNISLALDLEKIVRDHGALPATIGVIDGVACVGLTEKEIRTLASAAGNPETMKVSRRDLPFILGMGLAGKKLHGGTTVAATMLLASRAGIAVFGTGGLGGVHRGAENTMDISADLTELGRTPVAVISSGCKSFLDIPKTLEYLETQGVTVCTFADGRTGKIDFPAFYTRESGVQSPMVIQSPQEAAAIIRAQKLTIPQKSSRCGLLFANPIPEEYSIPKLEIDEAINQAVREATEQGFHGHANTPFILSKIKELTKGNSIPANRALIESNVAMAAQVAVELSKISIRTRHHPILDTDEKSHESVPASAAGMAKLSRLLEGTKFAREGKNEIQMENNVFDPAYDSFFHFSPRILVIGSVAVDLSCNYAPQKKDHTALNVMPEMHTSNIATITPSIGGVGYNVALAAYIASGKSKVSFHSFVGDDLAGSSITSALETARANQSGFHQRIGTLAKSRVRGVLQAERRTAQYIAINDANKNLVMAMADMSIFDEFSDASSLSVSKILLEDSFSRDLWIVVDANWSPSILKSLVKSRPPNSRFIFEPVSVPKAGRIFGSPKDSGQPLQTFPGNEIYLSTPNQYELAAMHATAKKNEYFETQRWWEIIDALGIPSSGARDRFVSITNAKMTDEGIPLQTIQLLPYIPKILTKLGAEGVLLTELLEPDDPRLTDPDSAPFILSRTANGSKEVGGVYIRLFPPVEVVDDIVSVNGVGDTFLGVLVAGLEKGCKLDEKLIHIAQRGAVMTLKRKESVSPNLAELLPDLMDLAVSQSGGIDKWVSSRRHQL
ncbi:uncharacterized protein LY89DRAFT_732237 [Mollisia scopiformis]|uniref:Carbohydrate kinase PfkB domain-containing protein n=1 Tax=Mollisia scopiformis TaxID=149040 RepID=A0A194XEX0_MOLSC|nr:uncharacterized protein LY89DRAFT_732237 [Mollisia scopiformis]KUJ18684.1 hypothetical protein LY89DRAFT_732237 [Mollisia scopiformis]